MSGSKRFAYSAFAIVVCSLLAGYGAAAEGAADTRIQWDASRETVARVMYTLRLLKLGVAL